MAVTLQAARPEGLIHHCIRDGCSAVGWPREMLNSIAGWGVPVNTSSSILRVRFNIEVGGVGVKLEFIFT